MHRAARGRGHGPAQLAAGQTRLNHESRSSHRPAVSPWASHLSCPNRASVCSPGNTGTEASRRADVSSEAANERNQDPNPGFPSCKASTILAHQKRGQHRRGGHEPARPVPSSHPPHLLRALTLSGRCGCTRTPAVRRRPSRPALLRPPPSSRSFGRKRKRRRLEPCASTHRVRPGNSAPRGSRPSVPPGPGRAAAMASAAVESFVTKQLDLLELERDAEVEERRYGVGRQFPSAAGFGQRLSLPP